MTNIAIVMGFFVVMAWMVITGVIFIHMTLVRKDKFFLVFSIERIIEITLLLIWFRNWF